MNKYNKDGTLSPYGFSFEQHNCEVYLGKDGTKTLIICGYHNLYIVGAFVRSADSRSMNFKRYREEPFKRVKEARKFARQYGKLQKSS